MDLSLSPREQSILTYIRKTVLAKGYPPSVREIGQAVGLRSSSTVHTCLARLEAQGVLRRDPTKPRTIELLGPWAIQSPQSTVHVPLVGKVTAGDPITAIETSEEIYALPRTWVFDDENTFLLTVQGDSMINAGIWDGDWVIVHKQETAQTGDIVVAMTPDNEATVKRFSYDKDTQLFCLQPENPCLSPLYYKKIRILGRVTGLVRLHLS